MLTRTLIRSRATRVTIAALVAAAAMASGTAAFASKGDNGKGGGDRASSFNGSCQLHATVTFTPPATATPTAGGGYAQGSGPCTGTFTDRKGRTHQLNGDTVGFVNANAGTVSCTEGIASGGGYLLFGDQKLAFTAQETRVGPTGTLSFQGASAGSAQGEVNISPSSDAAAILQQCSSTGLNSVAIDINLQTTPSMSG